MIIQTLEYQCDAKDCKAIHSESERIAVGARLSVPCLPQGWIGLMGGGIYCPLHVEKLIKSLD